MKKPRDQKQIMSWLRYGLCGALIGAGAILPGVSGGVLAAIFDIYRPMMEILTHPKTALPKYWRMFPPLGIGWCVGFLVIAKGISAALTLSGAVTTWLFIGLIFGTIPSLFREAGKEGRSCASWVSLALCAFSLFAGLYYVSHVLDVTVPPNFWWFNFCGALWGMSVISPGMTSSSIMMALGLYQPMLDGLARRGAQATFFLVGERITGNEDVILRMEREGHQVGLHSQSHMVLAELNSEQLFGEVEVLRRTLEGLLGEGDRMLRPPYGLISENLCKWAKYPIILWSVDPEDWSDHNVERQVAEVLAQVEDGDIILLHDIYYASVETAFQVMDELMKRGFRLVTVEELFAIRGKEPEAGAVYRSLPPG